ncbi:MAG: glycosyltransferase family 4 protein [Chloroflexi bacterium]|nr:glycosyltransferase family 4 protein [Chloroflexota bacterium]
MDRPIKIGLISPYDHAFHGGVTNHINRLASQFREMGHTVRIVAPCSSPESIEDEDFIPMGRPVPIPSGGSIARVSLSIWLRPRIKEMLLKEKFDVIHLHEPFAGFVTLNVLSLVDMRGSVNVGTFHTNGGHKIYKVGGVKLAMPYYRKLHGRIAVSPPAHKFISRYFSGSFEIIPNGIDVDEFANAEPFPHLLQDGKINLLFLGRLEKRKGLKYLLSAYSRLKWDWPNLRLLVVGPGKPDADSYRIMGERNLQDVVFVGPVSDEDRARYFKSADIYCSPATGKESFGLVLGEAMAAGKPVIASSIEGYSSVIAHGKEGLLVPPKDDEQLASAIELLLKDHDLRMRLAANGRRKVDEFRWERVAGRVMGYYESLMSVGQAAIPGSAGG